MRASPVLLAGTDVVAAVADIADAALGCIEAPGHAARAFSLALALAAAGVAAALVLGRDHKAHPESARHTASARASATSAASSAQAGSGACLVALEFGPARGHWYWTDWRSRGAACLQV